MSRIGVDLMKTKEEYQEALERMKESYYNFDNCISAMNKFKEDINLLTGLVNEHFEENQETNLERYYDDLIKEDCSDFGVVNGKIEPCTFIPCEKCEFKHGNCHKNRITWLTSKCKKPKYKLTKFEFDLIQTYRNCHESCKLSEFKQLIELKDKGYFKDIALDLKIHEVLDNYEVTK